MAELELATKRRGWDDYDENRVNIYITDNRILI